jgi:hypothetical protein
MESAGGVGKESALGSRASVKTKTERVAVERLSMAVCRKNELRPILTTSALATSKIPLDCQFYDLILIILAAIGIVIACTPPEKPETRPTVTDAQEFSGSAKNQKPTNKNCYYDKEVRPYGRKKQKTHQENDPPPARDNQL